MPIPGMVTPATIGWNIVSSSCRPRKYHGAFEGFGVKLKLAAARNGALTTAEKMSRNAVMARAATNSPTSRWGQTWTLSVGVDLTSWIVAAVGCGLGLRLGLGGLAASGRRGAERGPALPGAAQQVFGDFGHPVACLT